MFNMSHIYIIFNISIYICVCLTYILPWKAICTMSSEKLRNSPSMLNQYTIIQQCSNASGEIILENQTHTCALEHTTHQLYCEV